nr:hypothetical protein B11C_110124 [Bartonella sp. 1-1C]
MFIFTFDFPCFIDIVDSNLIDLKQWFHSKNERIFYKQFIKDYKFIPFKIYSN